MDELFDVWIFFPDGTHIKEYSDVSAEEAVVKARAIILRPAVQLGIIARVMITDTDDICNFLWEHDKGIVFPKREDR